VDAHFTVSHIAYELALQQSR